MHTRQKKPKQGGQKLVIRLMAVLLALMLVLSLGSQIFLYANAGDLGNAAELEARHAELSHQRERAERSLAALSGEDHSAVDRYELLNELDELISAQMEADEVLSAIRQEELRWLNEAREELLNAVKDEEVVLECGQERLSERLGETQEQYEALREAVDALSERLEAEQAQRAETERQLSAVMEELEADPDCQSDLERLSQADPELEADILDEEAVRRASLRAPEPEQAPQAAQKDGAATESGVDGRSVAQFAVQFVGCPYKWGGDSLTEGCDCSGFIKGVFASFGIELPHFSGALQHTGAPVEYEQAQLGDLICYDGHVGIYLGHDKMVNAFDSKHGIIICSVNVARLVTVRRVV